MKACLIIFIRLCSAKKSDTQAVDKHVACVLIWPCLTSTVDSVAKLHCG